MPIKPERLAYGDTIGIVAPASPPPDPRVTDRGLRALESLGFKLKLAPNARRRVGFLAGTDRQRAGDLMRMFADKTVKAILCLRGGYGSARLLPLLNFGIIRSHPKIFIGYSDITSLHCALLTQANLVSFHGPTLCSDLFSKSPGGAGTLAREKMRKKHAGRDAGAPRVLPDAALQSFLRTLMSPSPAGSLCSGFAKNELCVVRKGTASGPLVGGNLSVLCTTIGTQYRPSFRKAILFLEDVGEAPYRIDRMLTHLLSAGFLQQVAGIAIGVNRDCFDQKAGASKEYRQSLEDVLEDRLRPLGVPVVTGLPFGHIPQNATLPVGVRATLDGLNGDLVITEGAVK